VIAGDPARDEGLWLEQACNAPEIQLRGAGRAAATVSLADVEAGMRERVAALALAALLREPFTSGEPQTVPEPMTAHDSGQTGEPLAPATVPQQRAPRELLDFREWAHARALAPSQTWSLSVGAELRAFFSDTTRPSYGARLELERRPVRFGVLGLFGARTTQLGQVRADIAALTLAYVFARSLHRLGWSANPEVEAGVTWARATTRDPAQALATGTGARPYVAGGASLSLSFLAPRGVELRVALRVGYAYGLDVRAAKQPAMRTGGPFAGCTLAFGIRPADPRKPRR
jgi:hypothetical protein